MRKSEKKSRNLSLISYVSKEHLEKCLALHKDSIRGYAYILHDKDDEIPHFHILLKLYSSWNPLQVCQWFKGYFNDEGLEQNTLGECISDTNSIVDYITHSDDKSRAEGKHQYQLNEIVDNGLFLFKDEKPSVDNTFEILMRMKSGTPYLYLVKVYGRDFVYHFNQYRDLLDAIKEQESRISIKVEPHWKKLGDDD